MTKKMKKESGFTLVEMLIVVAIIAILIAVSIPLVSSALEKARTATDAANERAFKAAISISYLGEDGVVKADDATVCVYDAVDGKVVADDVAAGYGQNSDHAGMKLYAVMDEDGEITMGWAESKPTGKTDIKTDTLVGKDLMTTEKAP